MVGIVQKASPNVQWKKINSFAGNCSSSSLAYYRPCPICGSLKCRVVLELNDFQFYSDSATNPKRVDVKENMCLDCGTLYLNPCYSEYGFRVLFAEAGQSYGSTEGRPQEQIEWLESRGLLDGGSSVLDVGCYDGSFLARLPDHVQKLGVDIDAPAIERGRLKHSNKGIRFIHGDFEHFQFSGNPPAAITMFHVLEHLPRPVEVLKKLRSIASLATKLIVEVPILENGKTNDINGFFSVQHMTHFTRSSLENCLSLGGWNIQEKVEQPDYNGCRVLATAQDVAEDKPIRASIAEDCKSLMDYLSAWYLAIGEVQQRVRSMPNTGNIVIWGGGAHTEFLYQVTAAFLSDKSIHFAIVDSDPLKHGKTWRGVRIYPPEVVSEVDWSSAVLLVSSYGAQESIVSAADELGVPPDRVVRIYEKIRRY